MLGLDRCRLAFTGAAPIAPDLIRWYLALGLDMREVYGQTENCGVATVMPAERIKLGSAGKAAPWGEVAISPEGEILIKGDLLFMGYLNQPEKTAGAAVALGPRPAHGPPEGTRSGRSAGYAPPTDPPEPEQRQEQDRRRAGGGLL